jgi:Cu/Zn superoxide dismutase
VKVRRLTAVLALALSFLTFVALAGTAAAADPLTITLKTQNNSGQSGTAVLTDMGNGTTKIVVDTTNPTAAAQPIHIHEGTCANLTPQVKYPLTTTANGKSETTVNVALSALLATPHAVNIHKSPQEAAVYVACGEIVATPGATPRTGGGGTANSTSPPVWGAVAALLTVTVAGAAYTLRRRAA